MTTHTHYTVRVMEGGGLARGWYTSASAYASPELARTLGPADPHIHRRGKRLALVRVETCDREDGTRRLLRETILEVLPD